MSFKLPNFVKTSNTNKDRKLLSQVVQLESFS